MKRTQNNPRRASALRPLCRALLAWLAACGALLVLGSAGAVTLALVLGDAAFDFPEQFRVAGRWLPLAAVAAALILEVVRIRRVTEQRLAALFETNNPSLGTRLTNAVQLGAQPGATPVEDYLRGEAVELGRQTAASLRAWPVARGTVLRALAGVAGIAAAWVLLATLGGEVLSAVWPRFVDPHGDHPPFSRLKIEVQPQAAEVLYGGQIEVRAVTSGRPVDKLWLTSRAGTNVNRSLMFLAPDRTFFLNLTGLREPVEYFATDGSARSHRFRIRLRYAPQITGLELQAEFPDYTGLAPAPVAGDGNEATLPRGTRVGVRALSNRPLRDGRILLTPVMGGAPIEIPLRPDSTTNGPAHAVTGSLTLTQSVAYAVSLRDVSGLDSTQPRNGRLNARPDAKPRLFVLEPGRDAVATPDFTVPVRVQSEDDHGVTQVFWLRGHNRSVERPFAMKLEPRGSRRSVEAEGRFALGELGVRPGDVIEYYFEAADNDPLGPNIALSRRYRLEIIAQEQLEEILRQQAAQQALFETYLKLDAWLRRMAEQSRQLAETAGDNSSEAQAGRRQAAGKLLEDLREFNRGLDALLAAPELFDVERSFRETLRSQQRDLLEAGQQLNEALGSGSGTPSAELLNQLAQLLTRNAEQGQRDVGEPAAQIAAVANLLAQADVFTRLAEEQMAVARQLERFAGRSGALSRLEEMEVRELADRERQLQQALLNWMESLPGFLNELPAGEDYDRLRDQVTDFLGAVRQARIPDYLDGAVKSLDQPEPDAGHALAQEAARRMDELIARCPGSQSQELASQCLRFQPSVSQAMGNTLQQILQAMGVGTGPAGRHGYSLHNRNVALYGSAGLQPGNRGGLGDAPAASPSGPRHARILGAPDESGLSAVEDPGPIRLNPDAPFPLRYRDLVGEYFRVIAESEKGGGR